MRELVLDNERRREVSDALGMSFGRLKALRRIDVAPRTMGELAAILGTDPPYMTIVVDDLEQQGLVGRKPHPTDRRAKLVETTAAGHEAARRARTIMNRPPAELTALPEAELGGSSAWAAGHPARSGDAGDRAAGGSDPPTEAVLQPRRGAQRQRRTPPRHLLHPR